MIRCSTCISLHWQLREIEDNQFLMKERDKELLRKKLIVKGEREEKLD